MSWYYDQSGQRQGPVSGEELDQLVARGVVNQGTLVWTEGMENWAPLGVARPSQAGGQFPPAGWIRCTATGQYFPPEEIVYLEGKPYSAAAKPGVLQGVMQSGAIPTGYAENRTGPAWESRSTMGFFKAGWETIKAVLTLPSQTFADMRREGGLGGPLTYYVTFASIGSLAGMIYQFGFRALLMTSLPDQSGTEGISPAFILGVSGMMLVGVAVLVPIFFALWAFIGAGALHLSLMICGGAKQPFETTFRTYCYGYGSGGVLPVVPFCGALVGGIWGLVSVCIGIAKTHEISTGRAVLAVLLPKIICCVGLVATVGAIVSAVVASQTGQH